MERETSFAVVQFVATNDVAAVPVGWIDNGKCFWPPKELQGKVVPHDFEESTVFETWKKHKVKILGFYANYSDAESKLLAITNATGLVSRQENELYTTSSQSETENIELEDLHSQKNPIVINLTDVPKNVRINKGEKYPSPSVFTKRVENVFSSVKRKSKRTTATRMKGEIEIDQNTILESLSMIIEQESQKPSTSTFETTNDSCIMDLLTLMPVKSDEHMEIVEQRLSDEVTFKQMVQVLKGIGGGTGNQLVTLILRRIMTDPYASTYSFHGQRGKKAFKGLKIYQAVLIAAMTNNQQIDITQYDVEKIVSNRLRHAKGKIEIDQNTILESLNLIIEHESQGPSTSTSESTREDSILDLMTLIPLKSDENMFSLERRLCNKRSMEQMIQLLKGIGGSTSYQIVTLMLRKIMTDQYASTYSFLGKRGKRAFKGLKVYHAIISAVRRNKLRMDISEYDVDKIISNWLRHAKGRKCKT